MGCAAPQKHRVLTNCLLKWAFYKEIDHTELDTEGRNNYVILGTQLMFSIAMERLDLAQTIPPDPTDEEKNTI